MLRTLSQKVFVTAGVFLVLIAVVAILAVASTLELRATTAYLAGDTLARIKLLNDIVIDLTRSLGETESFLRARTGADLVEAQAALDNAKSSLTTLNAFVGDDDDAYDAQFAPDLVRIRDQLQTIIGDAEAVTRAAPTAPAAETQELLDTLEASSDALSQVHPAMDAFIERDTSYITGIIATETQQSLMLIVGLCGICIVLVLLAAWMLRRQIVAPIRTLSAATMTVTQGVLDQAIRVTSTDEIGQLQRNFNTMVTTIQQEMHRRDEQMVIAQTARSEAEVARAAVTAQLATIETQQAVIREMSVPILPLGTDTLVMPLIGALDSVRLHLIQEQALRTIEQRPTQHFILDITGVPVIDTQVAHGLIRVIQAARLLGTQVLVVGIRPEIAQTLVGLGIQFEGVITRSTLQDGINYTLRRA